MATNPNTLVENAGRITPPDANYPYGSAKDDTTGTAGDGTPIKKALLNDTYGFIQAALSAVGIVPSGTAETATASQVLDALRIIMAQYSANGDFYTDSGTANAYVLTAVSPNKSILAYADGVHIAFLPDNTSTGAVTVNVAGLGIKTVTDVSGGALVAGDIVAGEYASAIYDSGAGVFRLLTKPTGAVVTASGGNANGTYRIWSDGTIEQWGVSIPVINGVTAITFPIPFLTSVDGLVGHEATSGTAQYSAIIRTSAGTLTTFSVDSNSAQLFNFYAKGV